MAYIPIEIRIEKSDELIGVLYYSFQILINDLSSHPKQITCWYLCIVKSIIKILSCFIKIFQKHIIFFCCFKITLTQYIINERTYLFSCECFFCFECYMQVNNYVWERCALKKSSSKIALFAILTQYFIVALIILNNTKATNISRNHSTIGGIAWKNGIKNVDNKNNCKWKLNSSRSRKRTQNTDL